MLFNCYFHASQLPHFTMFAVFDRIPHRFLSSLDFKFSELYRLRKQQRPVVAWYASDNEPNVLPLLAFVGFLFFLVFVASQVPGVLACRATLWQALMSLKLQRSHTCSPQPLPPTQLQRLHERYQHVVAKLNKVVKKYQALRVQLKVRFLSGGGLTIATAFTSLSACLQSSAGARRTPATYPKHPQLHDARS